MTYHVEIMPIALAGLAKLPKKVRANAEARIETLAENPRPPGVVKLAGCKNSYRLRVGNWRILYEIEDKILRVTVFSIAHRGDAYRRL